MLGLPLGQHISIKGTAEDGTDVLRCAGARPSVFPSFFGWYHCRCAGWTRPLHLARLPHLKLSWRSDAQPCTIWPASQQGQQRVGQLAGMGGP
jgi:hypothetical protein